MISHQTSVFLTVAIIVVMLFGVSTLATATTDTPVQPRLIYSTLNAINEERTAAGLNSLVLHDMLNEIALARVNDMVSKVYFGHDYDQMGTVVEFAEKIELPYIYIGENLALGYSDPISLVSAWMDSPDHRKNLLNGNYRGFGLAATETPDGMLIATIFSDVVPKSTNPAALDQPVSIIRAEKKANWDNWPIVISQFLQLRSVHSLDSNQ
ncbi:MAG: CAP domain-containing protein [Candidatus Kerfeldbacteria bacterium]|nr:CAP domain-containing protein [Candidatus Kerfeldbacteria bacterium]